MSDKTSREPAGPDRSQRFNSARLLIVSAVLVIFAVVRLVDALSNGGSLVLPVLLLGGGIVGIAFGARMVRRHWVKRDGLTLDEADPKRTPQEQQRRDDRVRKNNADMTPRQEVGIGVGLIPVAAALGAVPILFGDGFNYFLAITLAVLGLILLIRGLVRLRRAN